MSRYAAAAVGTLIVFLAGAICFVLYLISQTPDRPTQQTPKQVAKAKVGDAPAAKIPPKIDKPPEEPPVASEPPKQVIAPNPPLAEPKKTLGQLERQLRETRMREMSMSLDAIRLGRMSEALRKAGLAAAREVKAKGIKNVDRQTILSAMSLAPAYVINEKLKAGMNVDADKSKLWDEYFEAFVDNPRFADLLDHASLEECFALTWKGK